MSARPPRSRGKAIYEKPPLTHTDLVRRLQRRGLQIDDVNRAERYIRSLGYYRLSPYMIPLRKPGSDDFIEGTTFDQILDLYVFDRKLRLLVLDALERVEVAVRAATTDHMALRFQDPFWYCNSDHFKNKGSHQYLLHEVQKLSDARLAAHPEQTDGALIHRSALEHYLLSYGEPVLPPSWIVVENLTLGQLNGLVRNLKDRADRTAIARTLQITEPILISWLRSFVRVRNICAHHGRLWNTVLGVAPMLPRSSMTPWLEYPAALAEDDKRKARLYPVLIALQSLLCTLSPKSTWAQRLANLLDEHPNVPIHAIGMDPCWKEDPFWAQHLQR